MRTTAANLHAQLFARRSASWGVLVCLIAIGGSAAFAGIFFSAPDLPPPDFDFRPEIVAAPAGGRIVVVQFPNRGKFAVVANSGRADPFLPANVRDLEFTVPCSRYERSGDEEYDPDIRADCEAYLRVELQRIVAQQLKQASYDSVVQASKFDFERIDPKRGVFSAFAAGNSLRTIVETRDLVLARVRLLAFTLQGNALVSVESLRQNSDMSLTWHAVVHRYDRYGKSIASMEVADPDGQMVYGDYLVANERGEVGVLRVDGDTVALEWRTFGAPAPPVGGGAAQKIAPRIFNTAGFVKVSTWFDGDKPHVDRDVSRSDMKKAIDRYLNQPWVLQDKNFAPNRKSECRPEEKMVWSRPRQFEIRRGRDDQEYQGIPYKWGGYVSLEKFKEQISKGDAAGNTCACSEAASDFCVVGDAAGIDATGLVSRVWGTSRLTTESIEANSDPVPIDKLEDGDVIVKRGEHVRIYRDTIQGHREYGMVVVEASASCGGVCEKILTARDIDGYTPRRYKRIRG